MWRRLTTRPVVNEVESRQGYLDRPVLIVLVVSIALAVIFLFLVYPALK